MSISSGSKNGGMSSQAYRLRLRRLTADAVLVALALALSIVERWIPLELIVPVPGLKLGLANIVTLFALLRLRPLDALVVLLVRILIMGTITGPTTMLFSLGGGLLALALMWLLRSLDGRFLSPIGISLAGAAAHNAGQVAVASLILHEPLLLLVYLPILLILSLATGLLTGVAALPVIRRVKPLGDVAAVGSKRPPTAPVALLLTLLIAVLPLAGCSNGTSETTELNGGYTKYTYEFTGTFDTVIQFIGYARSQAEFDSLTAMAEARFRELNSQFDPFHDYDGVVNLKSINDNAGAAPVKPEPELFDLIVKCIEWNQTISDKTSIALGLVIKLWQTDREQSLANPDQATVPTAAELSAALSHSNMDDIVIDKAAGTVYLADPDMRLDLGAVGKGYATELVVKSLLAAGASSMVVNAGSSNVRLIGHPMDGRDVWSVGLQNPSALLPDDPFSGVSPTPGAVKELAGVLKTLDTSIVTSGDYQRYYLFDGQVWHHLLDPVTGLPVHYFRAVSIVTEDSGLADFLSTALFLMPYEDGRALVDSLDGVEALWIFSGDRVEMTDGLAAIYVSP